MLVMIDKSLERNEILFAFKKFDRDGNGRLTLVEFKRTIKEHEE
jgi:Ca2+-binding EF-hand superfamily protein